MHVRATVLFSALIVVVIAGCAARVPPSYSFSYPGIHKEEWTQTYPANRDYSSTKCVLRNERTGARMRLIEDAFHSPTPRDSALAYRHVLKRRGFEVDDEVKVSDAGHASFGIAHPGQGTKGKVVVTPLTTSGRCIVVIGEWPVENDAHARADADAVIRDLHVSVSEQ
jgi:hypothetical protein